MVLYDLLTNCGYDQKFYIYVTNNYDQNVPIFKGQKDDIFNGEGDYDHSAQTVFDFLMHEVDLYAICADRAVQVLVRSKHFDQRVEDFFSKDYVAIWDNLNPETRPWRHYAETEAFVDNAIKKPDDTVIEYTE